MAYLGSKPANILTDPVITDGSVTTAKIANDVTINFNAGSASTPSITRTGDTNTGIYFPAADTIAFAEGGVEAMRIDSSGNVGIGTSSPAQKFHIAVSSGNVYQQISSGANSIYFGYVSADAAASIQSNGAITFLSGGSYTERMRIDSSGNVGVRSSGTTTPTYDFNTLGEGLWSRYWDNSGARTADIVAIGNTPAGATQIMRFLTNTGGSPGTAVERGRFDASGNFAFNSGYGSVATAYGCRAWVNFNGTGTVAIRASGNVSSITDNGTGDYTVNFSTSMPDINYSVVASSSIAADGTFSIPVVQTKSVGGNGIVAPTTSAVRLTTQGNGGSAGARDAEYVNVSIHR